MIHFWHLLIDTIILGKNSYNKSINIKKEGIQMKVLNKKSLLLSSVAIGMLLASVSPVQAATTKSNSVETKTRTIKNDSIENDAKLTKQGYVLRIKKGWGIRVYVGKANYKRALTTAAEFKTKTANANKLQNIKFRVERVGNPPREAISASPVYLVASKDKKYSAWLTQSELEYYYLHDKAVQSVIKPLKKIISNDNKYTEKHYNSINGGSLKNKKNKQYFNQALAAAKKMPKGSKKTFVLNSLNQLKKNGHINNGGNMLLFGL